MWAEAPPVLTASCIESVYQSIAGHMRELPLFNPALGVRMVGWQSIPQGRGVAGQLGVLVTPWCMNLWVQPAGEQLCPANGSDWLLELDGFQYRLTMAEHPVLGRYASVALESLMGRFVDMDSACRFAVEALAVMIPVAVPAAASTASVASAVSRRGFLTAAGWRGAGK